MYQIFDYRTCIGKANTLKQAEKILMNMLSIPKGMKLTCSFRPQYMAEILGLPIGIVYSIHN